MARIKKRSVKASQQPQLEIRSIAHTVSDYYLQYQKQFNAVLLIAALLVAGAGLYFFVQSGNERKAGVLLEQAMLTYEAADGKDAEKTLQGFREVVKQYGTTLNGAIAQFYVGNTLALAGRADEALKEYEAFTKRYAGRKELLGLVLQRMGYLYLSQGKTEEAMKVFQRAESSAGTGAATLELARLYDRSGKTSEAQAKYKELAQKYPATTWALEAQTKMPPPELAAPRTAPAGTPGR